MPTTRRRGAAIVLATLGVLLSGALTGCSLSKDDEPQDKKSSTAEEPTPTDSSEPTDEPTQSPAPTPTTPAPTPGAPEAALLGAKELPQLNETSAWTVKETKVPGATSFGLCQQFDLLSIGAMSVFERTYTNDAGDTAAQQIAEFPDAQNTVRAGKVLEAWHDECADQVKGKKVKIRPITAAPVAKGKGWWYLVSYTKGGTGHFHSFGVVINGPKMTLLTMDHAGQDHNYEPGQDPMELAVKAASAKM
jgi:hypothetical protein